MATRKDVAAMAGVSPAVVSYVLNNSNYVSEEKRIAVMNAVKALDYQPNYIGRSLQNKKTYNLGLVCDDIRSELFAEIAYYSEKYAYENGYKLFLCTSHQDEGFLRSIVDHSLDGIFVGTSIFSVDQINRIARSNIPVVLWKARHYEQLDPRVKCIRVEYHKAAYLLTERLIQKGYEKIAYFPPYLSGISILGDDDYRYKGYRDALAHYGYAFDEELVCFDNGSYEAIQAKAESIFRDNLKAGEKIAYVTGNDYTAIQIMNHLKRKGLYSRERIAITGMDNTASSMIVSPSLTTIGFSKADIAKVAIDYLVHGVPEKAAETVNVTIRLIEGESG